MPETSPNTPLQFVYSGRIGDAAKEVESPDFVGLCRTRYEAAGFGEPGESEVRSWTRSWPSLLTTLVRAGLQDLWIYLEFSAADGASRFDALVLGEDPQAGLTAVIVELKQWSRAQPLSRRRVRVPSGGETTEALNPAVQVGAYVHLVRRRHASETAPLTVRGVSLLHNASEDVVQSLRSDSNGDYPIISKDQVAVAGDGHELARLLRMDGLEPPSEALVHAFEHADWSISQSLLTNLGDTLEKNSDFVLVGDQQHAFVSIRDRVADALSEGKQYVVLVKGGPGSGKTVLAIRLLAHYLKHDGARPRYFTPSGTLVKQLREKSGDNTYHDLFQTPGKVVRDSQIVFLDEAHRLKLNGNDFATLLSTHFRDVPVVVVFLDERQVIRPDERISEDEVRSVAERFGARVVEHSLTGNFRCGGSRSFGAWVDDLLYGTSRPWEGPDYDLGVVENPSEMEHWLEKRLEGRGVPRISAGFCWPWKKTHVRPPLPEVRIEWEHGDGVRQTWERPWNLNSAITDDNGEVVAPESQMWATQPGGEHQIGCVYTAQGLEYDHAGVILGPDLVRRDGRWVANAAESRDWVMKGVRDEEYLTYALNIYRVLMTRGMRSCRLYSTDRETQDFLASLMPRNPA